MIETTALSKGSLDPAVSPAAEYLKGTFHVAMGVVMGDRTGMLHQALPYGAASERTLHRTTIAGDEALS